MSLVDAEGPFIDARDMNGDSGSAVLADSNTP